jgi:hypothetical protein
MNSFTSVLLTTDGRLNWNNDYCCRVHALHSAKLAIEGEREWTSSLPPDLTEFCSGGLLNRRRLNAI